MSNHSLKWTERDAVENAFRAFVALSAEQKREMVARYTALEQGRAHPDRLEWTQHERNAA